LSSVCFADNLSLEIQAKDISVKGTFGFKPGGSLKISGSDVTGKPYDLEIISKGQKDDVVQFICRLDHGGKKNSVSAITKKGTVASIASGPKGQSPDLKLDANWTE
jgi:hypothetical protein